MAVRAGIPGFDQGVDVTLRWVVVAFRLLAWVWALALIGVVILKGAPGSRPVLAAAAAVATLWAGFTVWASRSSDRLHSPWFAVADGVVVFALGAAGWIAGTEDFVSGGYPGSWLFVVAYATNLRWTMLAAVALTLEHVVIHDLMNLGLGRTVGTFQFIVFGLIAGWAYEALRLHEQRRHEAETRLEEERRQAVRLEQGARLGQLLHDSVLQTMQAIRSGADDPKQVRYLARWQERELRRTIEELRSPYQRSFRAELLAVRDGVEDLYRSMQIAEVIRDDAEMTPALEVGLGAAREAMTNAAKHAGVEKVDLYAEVSDGSAVIHVRDRGQGFDPSVGPKGHGWAISVEGPIESVGGSVTVDSAPGAGTEVTIQVPAE
jgi:signal transduction histidine kinase